jgi:DNA-binding transcriptional regulator YiaG
MKKTHHRLGDVERNNLRFLTQREAFIRQAITLRWPMHIPWDAHKFARRRVLLKLTQTELADTLGVHRNTVANWENGRNNIPETAIQHLEKMMRTQNLIA